MVSETLMSQPGQPSVTGTHQSRSFIANRPDLDGKGVPRPFAPPARGVSSSLPTDRATTVSGRAARKVAAEIFRVDWECQLETSYSDVNLGCGRRVSSRIDWVFQNAEEAQ